MELMKKRKIFLGVLCFLIVVVVLISVVILLQGPRTSPVELVSNSGGELVVNDLYEGNMTIPNFNIPLSQYAPDQFSEKRGVVTYEGGPSAVGINVSSKTGEIDWEQVAQNGVDFAMIRVGHRKYDQGTLVADENFETNIQGALDAGLPVGVYFYSKAVTDAEADEEAAFVLERIRGYTVTYPVAFYWEYDTKEDGSLDESRRTVRCNGEQVTGFIDTFCKKIEAAGYDASYYCDKTMGYTKLDLSRLAAYDMWYAEFRTVPSFYYDYGLWQYTKEGSVPGISKSVPITLALKEY